MIDRDDVNAKRKKVINLFNKTVTDETDAKENDNVKFKLKKKKTISFKIVTTTNERNVIMKKKVSIENNNFYMFETFNVKNSIERTSTKHHIDNTMLISNLFETLTFDVEIFIE